MKIKYFLILCSTLSAQLFAANSRISDDELNADGTVYNRFGGEVSPEKKVAVCIANNCEKNISLLALPFFETKAFNDEAEKIRKYNRCMANCGSTANPLQIEKLISLETIIKDCELTLMTFQKDYYHREFARLAMLSKETRERNGYGANIITDDLFLVQKDLKATLCKDVSGGIKNIEVLSTIQKDLDACVERYKIRPASVDKLFLTNVQLVKENLKTIKRIDNSVLKSMSDLYSSCLGLTYMPSSYEIKSSSRFHNPKVLDRAGNKPARSQTEGR